jgi:TDG/mug DNA glycosylase family protein
MAEPYEKPTKAELQAAEGTTIPDVIAPGLKVLFCGINPGLYSGAVGHHFAYPGNRFWPAIWRAGYTERILEPYQAAALLDKGYGLTNVVERATARASDLSPEEFEEGARRLRRKLARYRPAFLAILGIGAYRKAFGWRQVTVGEQVDRLGDTRVWVLPNPSGLNAHYRLKDLARLYAQVRLAAEEASTA